MHHMKDRLNMKLLRSDKQALMEMAASQGETMSVIIRRLIRRELEDYERINNQQRTYENK